MEVEWKFGEFVGFDRFTATSRMRGSTRSYSATILGAPPFRLLAKHQMVQ